MDLLGGPTGLLELALTATQDIDRRSKDVTIHRQQCMQLAKRCAELVNTLRDQHDSSDSSKLTEAVDELEEVLLKIRKRVIEWANLNRVRSFMRQDQIAADIDNFNQTLDTHVTKFQIVSSLELNRQTRRMDLYRQHDQEEVKEMLRQIVRNVEDLQVAVGMREDVPALMKTIQREMGDETPGTDEHNALRGGLKTLHNKTGILPPLTDLTGQVIKLSEFPAAEGGTADIYEGQWVGDEKVMLKAIRHVESESAMKRFRREIDTWRRLQNLNILRFYGICYIGGRLFAVAPWADNGNLVIYIRNTPGCDRMQLLSEVARGLMYLHTFKPMIVHGDLRGANVVVSASGEALLADFGLSKIIAEEEGASVASTSLANAGSSRWMAPELFEGDTNSFSVSAASDVWSFGMLSLEVLTGYPPFRNCRIDGQVIAKLIGRTLPERPELSDEMYARGLSDEMWALMQKCWGWRPETRPQMGTLEREVRKLHLEHMRQYGVAGESNNSSSVNHPSTLIQGRQLWTPTSSSIHSLSPSSLPLQTQESPRPYITDDLPSPHSPTNSMTPRYNSTAAIPIPGSRADSSATQQLLGMTISETPPGMAAGGSLNSGSMPRSPTLHMFSQGRDRSGTFNSHVSAIAIPHPDGQEIIHYDEHGRVLTGNLEGLVERLLINTHSTRMDDEFRECFLTVYRGFAKADDLLPLLITQYNRRAYSFMPEKDRAKLRKNMLVILRKWLEIQQIEPKDYGFLQAMQVFASDTPVDEPLDSERKKLQEAIIEEFKKLNLPSPLPRTNSGQRIRLYDLDPGAIARQLMRIESELFRNILASDCAAWVKNVSDEHLLNLPRFMNNNYKIADWCQSLILFVDSNEIERRAQMIVFLKSVAEECFRIRSYSTAHAILAGLTTDFINGLGYTWRLVDKRTKDTLKQISHVVSDDANYKTAIESEPKMPAVPILMVHLRDLRRSYKEMKTYVRVDGEELVNFEKFEEVWKSIQSIMKYKTPQPDIPNNPMVAAYLEHAFSQIDAGEELQRRFNVRSEELKKKEQRDYENRRLGMEDAGFRAPKGKSRK